MEEGVINEMLKGPISDILDTQQLLYDVSGAGNNWAHGHHGYGPQYHDRLLDNIRRQTEDCDSLQGFLLLHSLGGGTGSGLGTYILGVLQDEFPDVFRFSAPVFPSEDDHVVTSPYNALLAANELIEHADCVLPVENQALIHICERLDMTSKRHAVKEGSSVSGAGKAAKPFDAMNGIAANLLLHLTSSVRFEGSLNVDLNDITMNLVPFPRMHFLISSLAPLSAPKDVGKLAAPRTMDQLFTDAFSRDHQLIWCDPRHATYLATALVLRGQGAAIGDMQRNVGRIRSSIKMAHWNTEGFKLGLCSQPPVGLPHSLMCLANNCCIADTFSALRDRSDKLYKRRLFVHHYEEYMDPAGFTNAHECVSDIISRYREADNAVPGPITRMRPRGLSFL
eukprot:jgi/Chrzof1/1090/Cz01g39230.t1